MHRREVIKFMGTSVPLLMLGDRLQAQQLAKVTPQAAEDFCNIALKAARQAGADYADIRLIRTREQSLFARNNRLADLSDDQSYGFGVRCLYRGAWGFASSSIVSPESARTTAQLAVEIAKASALSIASPVLLAPEPPHRDRVKTPRKVDPFEIPLEQKAQILLTANEQMQKVPEVKVASGQMLFIQTDKFYASTEGSFIQIEGLISTARISAAAAGNNDQQSRTYELHPRHAGWEFIEQGDLKAQADRVAQQAKLKLTAQPSPQGKYDLVLDGSNLFLTIHESVGHPTELDRVLGYEADYAGTSFATTDKLGKFAYGSKSINFVADNIYPEGLASTGYDDDGVQCQRWDLVKEGTLVGYSTNREVAPKIGATRSVGSCRAQGWDAIPIVRIANVGLAPGSGTPEDLIKGVKDGIYIEGDGTFSIDQQRLNFQFGGDMFYRIRDGEKAEVLKDVVYRGVTYQFWGSCDAVAGQEFWRPYGVLNCGKGQPGQAGRMTHGAAPARFRQIDVASGRNS
ncbi:TldD/PmbA family protein [Anthocerotibacter panamensis]|uniref:TldD/PmbA family protein n=1 Tax=Anthocerotibacter panamensis TaxID=2857077 RepID=UPI001C40383F|nr:TldD/PmbA family protein [Anthocerotibacter panamensis]